MHSMGTEGTDDEGIVNDSVGCKEVKTKCLQRGIQRAASQFALWNAAKAQELEVRMPQNVEGRQGRKMKLFQRWSKQHLVPCRATLTVF